MLNDFSTEYSELTDDELLHIASDRSSLTAEAALALDAELLRRHLSASDQLAHQKFVKRQRWRESRSRHRKLKTQTSWREGLSAIGLFVLVIAVYFALPKQYRLGPAWQEAASEVALVSIFLIVFVRSRWRDILFWIALLLSSAIQSVLVHAWVQREGPPNRGAGKGAVVLGFLLFFAIYGGMLLIRRNFYGEPADGE